MLSLRRHITFANVASLMALVFSMAGGAMAAHHYLINSTSQINPKVLKKLRSQGEIGPVGPQGPTGLTGPRGPGGGRGEAYPQVLASGGSESGQFGMRGNVEGAISQNVTFRVPLASAIAKEKIEYAPSENCKTPGEAPRGYLCIFTTAKTEATAPKVFDAEVGGRPEEAGRLGFTLEVQSSGVGAHPVYEGSYTVTAP